jgi:transposase
MEAIVERCCGLDVHQAVVFACVAIGPADRKPQTEVRRFGTTTRELASLREWLAAERITHVAMESTGVYWIPVYTALEGHFELVVGNAHHIKNVPGRKTDVRDCEWIADLQRHGLIRKSFVPGKPFRELRDLLRYRRKLANAGASERNRLLKLLETAGIKLASVASDVFGVSGRAMLKALIAGETCSEDMARLARGRMRRKQPQLVLALEGNVEEHHRFLLAMQLQRIEQIEAHLDALESRIAEKLLPYADRMALLQQIPGVDWVVAATIIAEIGVDMSVFENAAHCAAWAGLCPGNDESAGKRRRGKARKGNVHLKTALVTAAVAASKRKGSYLKDKYYRLKARRGALRAAVAIGHKILVAAYHMLATGSNYKDLGPTYLDLRQRKRTVDSLVRRLRELGYDITLQPKAA